MRWRLSEEDAAAAAEAPPATSPSVEIKGEASGVVSVLLVWPLPLPPPPSPGLLRGTDSVGVPGLVGWAAGQAGKVEGSN